MDDMVARLIAAHSAVPERLRFATAAERVEGIWAAHQRGAPIGPRCRELATSLLKMLDGTPETTAAWRAWTKVALAAGAVAEAESAAREAEQLAAFVRTAEDAFSQPPLAPAPLAPTREVSDPGRAPGPPQDTGASPESASTDSLTADREPTQPVERPVQPTLTPTSPAAAEEAERQAAELLWPLPDARSAVELVPSLQSLRGRLGAPLYEAVLMTERSEERGRIDLLEGDLELLWDEYQAYPPVGLDPAGLRALLRLGQRVRRQTKAAQRAWGAAISRPWARSPWRSVGSALHSPRSTRRLR